MSPRLTWHGHSNFCLQTPETVVYIDPFFTGNPRTQNRAQEIRRADLLLVTHDHQDHCGDYAVIWGNSKARLVAVVGTAQSLAAKADHNPDQNQDLAAMNIGGTLKHNDLSITMTEAFHTSDSGAPVGFIIRLATGYTIYHAGDTGIFQNMALLGELYPLDLALLPIGGFYTMDSYQAAHAARLLNCRQVIPMHWGTFPVLEQNTQNFAQHLSVIAPQCRLLALSPDQTLELT